MPELLETVMKERGAATFWFLMIAIAAVGLFYIGLFGFAENNFRAIAVSFIFSIMLVFSIAILGRGLFVEEWTLANHGIAFWSGALIWGAFAWLNQAAPNAIFSSITITTQQMLSTVAQQMPAFWNFFVTVFTAPIIEEMFFLLALPVMLFIILKGIGKYIGIFGETIVQLPIVIIVSAITFAFFHTGQAQFVAFVTAAMIFRGVQVGLLWGDAFWDVIKFTTILGSFAVGAHFANNFFAVGTISENVALMASEPFGWVLLGVLALLAIIPMIHYLGGGKG